LRARRTRLRWAVTPAGPAVPTPRATFSIENETLRTLRLVLDPEVTSHHEPADFIEFCRDFAIHDWLLTTILDVVQRSGIGFRTPAQVVERLRPAVDHIMHLWLPGARLQEPLAVVHQALEQRIGLSRQWQQEVARIRDHLALATISLLGALTDPPPQLSSRTVPAQSTKT
jgi:hypothetical protein